MAETEMAENAADQATTVDVDADDATLINRSNKDKIWAGIFHMTGLALASAIIVPLARRTTLSPENICGIAFMTIYVLYLAHIWYLFLKAPYLYRIYTVSYRPSDWAPMSIAKHMEVYNGTDKNFPPHTIDSISEFSAIAGGVAKMLLARIGTMTWGILMTLLMSQIKNDDIKVRISLILECIGAFGIDMIGTFYDDPKSPGMRHGHYTGVGLAICCLVGFWIQRLFDVKDKSQKHLWLPSIMTVLFAVFFALFTFYNKWKPLSANPSKKEVSDRSRLVILFETFGLGALSFSFCFYFILYPADEQ